MTDAQIAAELRAIAFRAERAPYAEITTALHALADRVSAPLGGMPTRQTRQHVMVVRGGRPVVVQRKRADFGMVTGL